MSGTNNIGITQVSPTQDGKTVTINDAFGAYDSAITESLDLDFTSADVTLTDSQFRGAFSFVATNLSTARLLTVPAIKRFFFVDNSAGTDTLSVVRGSTSIDMLPGGNGLFYADGTTDGLTQAAGGGSSGSSSAVETETASSYSFVIGDVGKWKILSDGSGVALTVPPEASVSWPAGTEITIVQGDAGPVTVAGGSGVTVNVDANLSLVTGGQYAVALLKKTGTNEWLLTGDLVAADDKLSRLWEDYDVTISSGELALAARTGDSGSATLSSGTVTDITGLPVSERHIFTAADAGVLEYDGSKLITPTADDIVVAAGDTWEVLGVGTDQVRVLWYTRADGKSLGYEAGTWTPALTFATPGDLSITYHANTAGYYSVDNDRVAIHAQARTTAFTHSTASGSFTLDGSGFALKTNVLSTTVPVWLGGYTEPAASAGSFGYMAGSSGVCQFFHRSQSSASSTFLTPATLPSGITPWVFISSTFIKG